MKGIEWFFDFLKEVATTAPDNYVLDNNKKTAPDNYVLDNINRKLEEYKKHIEEDFGLLEEESKKVMKIFFPKENSQLNKDLVQKEITNCLKRMDDSSPNNVGEILEELVNILKSGIQLTQTNNHSIQTPTINDEVDALKALNISPDLTQKTNEDKLALVNKEYLKILLRGQRIDEFPSKKLAVNFLREKYCGKKDTIPGATIIPKEAEAEAENNIPNIKQGR